MVDAAILNPVAAFTQDGALVIVGERQGSVCRVDDQGVLQCRPFEWPGPAPLAVLPTDRPNEFAVFTSEGLVKVMAIQAG